MKIYHHIDEFIKLPNAVVTIGTFDGVHLGHRKIIIGYKRTGRKYRRRNGTAYLFSHIQG